MFNIKYTDPDLENCGKFWNKEENENLFKLIEEGKSIKEIALSHKRTENSILCKLKYYAKQYHNNGMKNEEIKNKLKHLSNDDIETAITYVKPDKKKINTEKQKNIEEELKHINDKIKMLLIIVQKNNEELQNMKNKIVELEEKQSKNNEEKTKENNEDIWTTDLLNYMNKYKNNKIMLKKIRTRFEIEKDVFYEKLKTL
jgi:hypothetical protein